MLGGRCGDGEQGQIVKMVIFNNSGDVDNNDRNIHKSNIATSRMYSIDPVGFFLQLFDPTSLSSPAFVYFLLSQIAYKITPCSRRSCDVCCLEDQTVHTDVQIDTALILTLLRLLLLVLFEC